MTKERGRKAIATNRRARHLYVVLDTIEAGIALVGNEVKSLRLGRASLSEAFATVDHHEVWMHNLHIAQYAMGGWTKPCGPSKTQAADAPRRDPEMGTAGA